MTQSRTHRTGAILVSAALLASLAATTAAAPTVAAKPKCMGQTATIVGTNKADVIRGTAKRDVIVAKAGNDIIIGKAGNDIICGNAGNDRLVGKAGADRMNGGGGRDRLFGGPGPDRLFGGPAEDLVAGQAGNDVLDGGLGVDTCYQGLGAGPVARCELPIVPTPLPLTGILAIAYSDIDGLDGYSTGDVLIAKLVDTNADNTPSVNDTIITGMFPTTATPTKAADFVSVGTTSHTVTSVGAKEARFLNVNSTGGTHEWTAANGVNPDSYWESDAGPNSLVEDKVGGTPDSVHLGPNSPSKPAQAGNFNANSPTDDGLIDVEHLY